jgi:hypothetical protein
MVWSAIVSAFRLDLRDGAVASAEYSGLTSKDWLGIRAGLGLGSGCRFGFGHAGRGTDSVPSGALGLIHQPVSLADQGPDPVGPSGCGHRLGVEAGSADTDRNLMGRAGADVMS